MEVVENIFPECDTCKHCLSVKKHPWNKGNAKGSISEHFGFVCLETDVFMDRDGVGCEMHEAKGEE